MVKTTLSLTIVFLVLVLGASSAGAQTSIVFGNGGLDSSNVGVVTFTANGGGTASLDIGTCSGGATDVCTLSGPNTGGGSYSFITTENLDADIQVGGFISGLNRGVAMNGATTVFSYSGPTGTLTGDVVWTSLITNGHATIDGILTITASTLSGDLGPTAIGKQAFLDFTTQTYLPLPVSDIITGAIGAEESAQLSGGEVAGLVPEPSSMLLFGSGLLMAGGILRRRLTLQA